MAHESGSAFCQMHAAVAGTAPWLQRAAGFTACQPTGNNFQIFEYHMTVG